MSYSKAIILALLVTISLAGRSQPTNLLELETLVKQAKTFVTEDPNKAQQLAKILISKSKSSNNQKLLVESYLIYAESGINFKLFDEAKVYLDSAIAISTRKNLLEQQIHCLILFSKLGSEQGDNNLFLAKLSDASSLAKKAKLINEEIRIDLIMGDFLKSSGDFDRSLTAKKKALEKSIKLGNKQLTAESWNSIGSTYWYFSHFQDALENYYKSYIIRESLKDTLGIIASLKNLGLVYRDLSNFDKALSQLNQALKLTDETNSKLEISEILNLLGSLHYRFNRYNEAILYYKQSLDIRTKNGLLNSTANTLENLARVYSQKLQFDDAYKALDEALRIREQLQDQSAIASTLNEIGNLYNQKGNIAEALRRYLMSLKIREKDGNDQDIAKSLTNIGITYRKLGLIKNATVYLEQARDLITEGKDPSEAAYVLINLGNLYIDQKQFDIALKVFQEALTMRKKTGDEASLARTLRNIAQVQAQIGQTDKARDNYIVALKFSQKLNDGKAVADTYNDLGNLERQVGNLKVATNYFEDAIKIYDESANYEGKALCLRKIGEIQIKQEKFDIAEKSIDQSISIGKEIGNMVLVHFGYLAKHEFYKSTNNNKLALEFFTKHIRIRDSIDNSRRNEKNLEAQLDLELDKKKEEIKSMEGEVQLLRQEAIIKEFEIKKQRVLKYFAIALAILILGIAGLAIWGYRQKKKHNQALKDKIAIIRDINDKLYISEESLKVNIQTKDKLFSIIAHDLKSPFNALVGLTEILSERAGTLSPPEIKEISTHINKSSNKVLTLIDNLLNWARSQTGRIKLYPDFISVKEIINSCIEVALLSAQDKNISIKSGLNETDIAYADKETVTTVIRNIISNAIKFTGTGGEITIWAYVRNEKIDIYITDTGVGMSKEGVDQLFQVDNSISTKGTNQESGTGLGLIICKEFIEKNSGSIAVESEINVGSTFIITLPNQKQKN